MSFRKPCHMPFRKLIPPFTLTGKIAHVASMTFMYYCETHKTVNTRNIYGMLLCCETSANNARDN